MRKHNVTDLVRVCKCTYQDDLLTRNGIKVHELAFPDGRSPPTAVVTEWLALIDRILLHPDRKPGRRKSSHPRSVDIPAPGSSETGMKPVMAVHCVAGLGRAPTLVRKRFKAQ